MGVVLRFCVGARSLFRAVPARAPEAVCLPTFLAVFAGVWEPEVSQPLRRQSPSAAHAADRLRGQRSTRFARSASLVTGRLTAATAQSLAHDAGSCETASNQGLL